MASQLARQLGPRVGHWGGILYSTYKNMPYRLDKSHSTLAEVRLKSNNNVKISRSNKSLWWLVCHLLELN